VVCHLIRLEEGGHGSSIGSGEDGKGLSMGTVRLGLIWYVIGQGAVGMDKVRQGIWVGRG
jgi:hypothetical protein